MSTRPASGFGGPILKTDPRRQMWICVAPPCRASASMSCYACGESGGSTMSGDSNSKIAWHRVQLKKNRDALKALETARFTIGEIARGGRTQNGIAELKRKIDESERCIAAYER